MNYSRRHLPETTRHISSYQLIAEDIAKSVLCFKFVRMLKSPKLPKSKLPVYFYFYLEILGLRLQPSENRPTRKLQHPKPASVCELTSDGRSHSGNDASRY